MVPSPDGNFLELAGKPLTPFAVEPPPPDESAGMPAQEDLSSESRVKLRDVAGYSEIKQQIDRLIIWPEKHRTQIRGVSRSTGVLFFGPPGCGKSRWALVIAGELERRSGFRAHPICEVLTWDGA